MRRVYLDHNASTPVHPDVLTAMLPYFSERFGNASSIHGFGREARDGIDVARESIAGFLGVTPEEIVFTSGGTESDNLAVKGVAGARPGGHVVTTQVEHHAVLRTCQALEQAGHAVTYLPVDGDGLVDPDDVRRALRPDTVLISIQTANSESGTLMPVEEIGCIATERGIPFHVDGVQTFGKLPVSLRESGIALMSMSSHKIYGPKGIGALYIRKGTRMVSVQHGGDHERRRRAGTENVPAIVGFGAACELAAGRMQELAQRQAAMRERLEQGLHGMGAAIFGEDARRIPNTSYFAFTGIVGETLVIELDKAGYAVAPGAACSSANPEPSATLLAMGVDAELARGAVRFSLGAGNTQQQVDDFLRVLKAVVSRLRSLTAMAV